MGIFSDIMGKIFGTGASAQTPAPGSPPTSAGPGASGGSSEAAAPRTSGASAPGGGSVDVGKVLADLHAKKGQDLNYKTSIVDLMKLLDLDSSLQARKALADELHYTGDKNDSATMNVWLHKQVVQKLADNGGKVPDDLRN